MKSSVVSQSNFVRTAMMAGKVFAKTVLTAATAITVAALIALPVQAGPHPASIVVDAKSGKVMFSEDPDALRYPASLTKMMTLYLVFEALDNGKISLNTKVPVSKHAASEPPSKLGVRPGQSFTVEQGIMALVTRSANDCSTAFGEFLGGSEARFGKIMTSKARALGMTRTVYYNANGLPDPRQVTTARDQARLGLALRKHFPQYYPYFSTRSFTYGRQVIGNHNRLLGAVRGVDGIKTGFTRAAGFNLVTSAQLDGRSIVGVVLGMPSGGSRNAKMRRLVEAYLPKASRKGGLINDMMASKAKTNKQVEVAMADPAPAVQEDVPVKQNVVTEATRSLELPNAGPVPQARYDDVSSNDDGSDDASLQAQANKMPAKKPKIDEVAAIEAPANDNSDDNANDNAKVDKLTTASTTPSGWVIQIGTSPEEKQAQVLLQKAQDKGGKVLRSATPFTVAFVKDNTQVFRARFGGFSDQDSAVKACKLLKKKGVSCWASLQ